MGTNKMTFIEGEKREVTATITSKNPDERVVIASAHFELLKKSNNSVIQNGTCEIAGNEVTVLLDLAEKGNYVLKITSNVGREVIKSKVHVEVE